MKIRLRFNLRKTLFILPNLFTCSSIFCGFYAMILSTEYAQTEAPGTLMQACMCILFSMVFDSIDGRVARLTKTQSEFGVQMDSLADVVSFGAAPAILSWHWGLSNFGSQGLFCCFVFCACGTIRLARFNVLASAGAGTSDFFLGLPIPAAAGALVAVMMTTIRMDYRPTNTDVWTFGLVLGLSFLMISNVKFRTFKRGRPSPVLSILLLIFIGVLIWVAQVYDPSIAIISLIGAYVASGMVEFLVRLMLRQRGEPDDVLDDVIELEPESVAEEHMAASFRESEEELID